MTCALFWSGGKNSLLALDRAQRGGLAVDYLVNICDGTTDRVRFHGIRQACVAAQASARGKPLIQRHTERASFDQAFHSALYELKSIGVSDMVFGNIHLADVRAWYETRVRANGFAHHEPL